MCEDCKARAQLARDAWLAGKMAEALGHVVTGAAEIVGVKEKTGAADLAAKPKAKRRVVR